MSIQTLSRSSKPIALRRPIKRERDYSRSSHTPSIDERMIAQFGRLIYKSCQGGRILDRGQVAELAQRVMGGAEITERMASYWISKVRPFINKEYSETFIYVKNYGYKIAEGVERIHQVSKLGHMTLKWRKRFMEESTILGEKELRDMRSALIVKLQKDEATKDFITDKFLLNWNENGKLLSREVSDGHKQITKK